MLLIENMIVVMFAFKLSWNEMHIYFIFLLNYRLFRYIKILLILILLLAIIFLRRIFSLRSLVTLRRRRFL